MTESTLHKTIEYEWIDILEMKQEDIAEISKKYDINHYWLEDCIDPNHLPKFEDNGNLKFFLTRLNTSTERLILNTISDVSTKLGIFLKDNLILTVHRIENDALKSLLKEIAIHPENFKTPYQLALHLGQKIFISFEQENEVLLDQLDKMENEDNVAWFLEHHPEFELMKMQQIFPKETYGDGFFLAKLQKKA